MTFVYILFAIGSICVMFGSINFARKQVNDRRRSFSILNGSTPELLTVNKNSFEFFVGGGIVILLCVILSFIIQH